VRAAVADLARHPRSAAEGGPPLARVFRLSYEALPSAARRTPRLPCLAPVGLARSPSSPFLSSPP
jgi:hypothetical protein